MKNIKNITYKCGNFHRILDTLHMMLSEYALIACYPFTPPAWAAEAETATAAGVDVFRLPLGLQHLAVILQVFLRSLPA